MILKVHDFAGSGSVNPIVIEDDRCYCTHNSNGNDQLVFELNRKSEDYTKIFEEVLVEGFGNRFVVKKIEEQSDFVVVTCELDFADWLNTIYVDFRKTGVTISQAIGFILPIGWIVSYGEGVSLTATATVEYQDGQPFRATNAKTILDAISTAFNVVFNFDTIQQELKVINMNAYVSSGDFFMEDLNMSNLKFTGNSSDIITRLYVYGKKNENTGQYLSIASVNDGKEYLEDFTYTDKLIVDSVVDERYTIPANLKAYGERVLSERSIPVRSYSFDISNLDGTVYLYKVVTIVDKERKLRLDHQCIKYVEYTNHALDKVTLSSIAPSIESIVHGVSQNQSRNANRVQELNDTIESVENLIIGTGGNFKWILNNDGNKEEFLILVDSDSIATATKLFKLDPNGLHYSSTGYGGEYITIIDSNGLITGASSTYGDLQGKPQIEGITLVGNKTFSELGMQPLTSEEIAAILV